MFWCTRIIFIHVPRTGGTMLTNAFGSLEHVSKDVHENKHLPASRVQAVVGEEIWTSARIIAVERSNDEIAKSWYQHAQSYYYNNTHNPDRRCTQSWWKFARQAALESSADFFAKRFVPTMEHYCDLPRVERLTLRDAYELLIQTHGYDPQIEIRGW